ncbi:MULTISPECIES: hypothetical protein [Enterobacter]|uniref:Uncharacterized protein n=2 Tax=Enterobacter cloacae complex TaxID=354276 RepID=A0A330G538_ENTCL|nr:MULTISPECIES: hypothetical protein [Enterobacter cloacae complex]MEC5764429.1 hypothetical protein [Enterobacter chengduensis]NBC81063.1 hypothetical protein [Enterobacter asburiae]RAZ62019.1 hypothetical protein DP202_24950 [Enterobacter cloacae]HBM9904664.1 hypothetical protein [Enterobacter chengduensis]
MTKKQKVLLALAALVMIVNAIYFYARYHSTYNIKCNAYVTYQIQQEEFSYDVVITMDLRNDASGLFGAEGTMRKGKSSWTLNRDVVFNYHRLQTNDIRLDNVRIIKYGRDNAPDDVFDRNFISLKDEAGRTISLGKVMNGYVVGTLRAPVFTCLAH